MIAPCLWRSYRRLTRIRPIGKQLHRHRANLHEQAFDPGWRSCSLCCLSIGCFSGRNLLASPHANVWEQHGVVIRFLGSVTGIEFVKAAQEICGEPNFDGLRYIVYDFTKFTDHSIGDAAIEEVATLRIGARMTNPNIRVVLVTTDDRAAALARAMNADPEVGTRETV